MNRTSLGNWKRGTQLFVGTDIVSIAEVTAALDRFGDKYIRRTFTRREASYCRAASSAVSAQRFAARFAAKEAALKALQPEGPWSNWRAIEVSRHRTGRCRLVLHGDAASLAARRGIRCLTLSMSHEGGVAAAVVIGIGVDCTQQRECQRGTRHHR